jgi:hypothetical protein
MVRVHEGEHREESRQNQSVFFVLIQFYSDSPIKWKSYMFIFFNRRKQMDIMLDKLKMLK